MLLLNIKKWFLKPLKNFCKMPAHAAWNTNSRSYSAAISSEYVYLLCKLNNWYCHIVGNSHSLLKATLYSAPLQNSTVDGLKLIKVAKCQEVQFTILHKGQFSNPLIIIGEYEV